MYGVVISNIYIIIKLLSYYYYLLIIIYFTHERKGLYDPILVINKPNINFIIYNKTIAICIINTHI